MLCMPACQGLQPPTTSAQLATSPSTINFNNVPIGGSQTQSATLTNAGQSRVVISQATVTGSGFSRDSLALPITLAAGQSVTCTVIFNPQSSGSVSGSVSI